VASFTVVCLAVSAIAIATAKETHRTPLEELGLPRKCRVSA
jgi:hypothetical protein